MDRFGGRSWHPRHLWQVVVDTPTRLCRAVLKSRTAAFVFSSICLDLRPILLPFNRGQLP